MPIAKAATNVQLASLANRLRLTLIRDRMTELLCMATEKKEALDRLIFNKTRFT